MARAWVQEPSAPHHRNPSTRTRSRTTKTIATTTDRRALISALATATLFIGGGGCASSPPKSGSINDGHTPGRPITGCLEQFKAEKLDRVLEACDAAVTAHPNAPGPLSDRALVLSLKGERKRACADVAKGLKLLQHSDQPTKVSSSDPMLHYELNVRHTACRQDRTIDAKG